MKKKVFIFSHAMEIGGAERALLGLLSSFDYSKYEVDLFLMQHNGELLSLIPDEVNLLPEIPQYKAMMVSIFESIKNLQFGVALGRMIGKIKAKHFNKKMGYNDGLVVFDYSHKFSKKYLPVISQKEYDIAISFLTPHYIVQEKVNAKKKLAWIHTDYSKLDMDVKSETEIWSKYDNIISISNDVTKAFLSVFASLEEKIVCIENILSKDFIDGQADLCDVSDEMSNDSIKLLSIGRFCDAKNFDNVPEIASIIKSKGIDFKWYIVGYGTDEALIRSKIVEYKMEDIVVILGKKENPYPYIKKCDIYVQPSRYEGKAVTVHEALILNKPVIIANYATAKSQVNDGFDGIIVPQDNQGCADGIARIILDDSIKEKLVQNMRTVNYSNEIEIEKLYDLIED